MGVAGLFSFILSLVFIVSAQAEGADFLGLSAQSQVPEHMEITNLQANGSGCPLGSVEQNISPDRQSFSLLFYEYIAEFGSGISRSQGRKACQITLNIAHSPGWRFSVVQFEFRGYFDLDAGIVADQEALYYFQADENSLNFAEAMSGPQSGVYEIMHIVTPSEQFWSSCDSDRAINIRTSIKLNSLDDAGPDAYGYIGTDTLDGTIGTQTWKLAWDLCP